jgi:hypothetical protein
MIRNTARVLVVAGLLGIGWVVGHAQAPTSAPSASSDFELLVTLGDGGTEVRCVRGCRLTWAPKGVDMLAPDVRVTGRANPKGCMSPDWSSDNCRILGWKR